MAGRRYTVGMAKEYSKPPETTIDANKSYSVTFDTSKGEIVCDLFAKEAPKTVNNFVFLRARVSMTRPFSIV